MSEPRSVTGQQEGDDGQTSDPPRGAYVMSEGFVPPWILMEDLHLLPGPGMPCKVVAIRPGWLLELLWTTRRERIQATLHRESRDDEKGVAWRRVATWTVFSGPSLARRGLMRAHQLVCTIERAERRAKAATA